MDYEKAYKDIQAEIKQIYEKPVSAMFKGHYFNGYVETGIRDAMMALMPNLAEIEDERIRKHIIELVKQSSNILCKKTQDAMIDYLEKQKEQISSIDAICLSAGIPKPYKDGNQWCILKGDNIQDGIAGFGNTKEDALVDFIRNIPIEKQKEPKEELFVRINGLINEYIKAGADEAEQEHRLKCYHLFLDSLEDAEYFEQKEQKPLSTEETELNSIAFLEQMGYTCIPPWKEQKPAHTAKEMWKEMRLEVYAQASGNRHEPNYSDDSTKMFSLCDIDEIFEKIGNSAVGSHHAEWSKEDENMMSDIIGVVLSESPWSLEEEAKHIDFLKSLRPPQYCENCKLKRSVEGWKPSKEQMKALNKVANEGALLDLFNDLLNLL